MSNSRITPWAGLLSLLITSGASAAPEMTTTSAAANSALTADVLAGYVVDTNSDFSFDSATVVIKNFNHPGASTDARAMGRFDNGNVAPGILLNDPLDPDAAFAGGIGIDWGVCLSTGFLEDAEPTRNQGLDPKVGVEGANDGVANDPPIPPDHEGEISTVLQASGAFNDEDWAAVHTELSSGTLASSGDPAVLQFDLVLNSPGFLSVAFAFGSDEYPYWVSSYNDTIAIIVKGPCTTASSPGENLATFVRAPNVENFSLQALADCEDLLLKNQMSPLALNAHPNSLHKISGGYTTYYDHEFGGFSRVLTRETASALAPGRYTLKFVIEDVADRKVDSALFIPANSVKLVALAQGDYNGDGCVNSADYSVWSAQYGQSNAKFFDGDCNEDCIVDTSDYVIWRNSLGNGGNRHSAADFNRDGCVNNADYDIWYQHYGMTHCASRYEGDANTDGSIDTADYVIWADEATNANNCGGCPQAAMAASGQSLKELMPENPDVNGNGVVDETDFTALEAIIKGAASNTMASDERTVTDTTSDSARKPALPTNPDINGDGVIDESDFAVLNTIIKGTLGSGGASGGVGESVTSAPTGASGPPATDAQGPPVGGMIGGAGVPSDPHQWPPIPESDRSLLVPTGRR